MKSLFGSILFLFGSLSGLATAQVPIPQFTPALIETFEAPPAPAAFLSFPGFPIGAVNQAIFDSPSPAGILFKNQDTQLLPPLRNQTCLYALGGDVRITFQELNLNKFGGFFSQTNVAGGSTLVSFLFFQGTNQVGNTVTVALPPTGGPGTSAYIGLFFDLSGVGGYNRVVILGSGGVFPGLVGMDNLIAR